jgi:hypothetical protein
MDALPHRTRASCALCAAFCERLAVGRFNPPSSRPIIPISVHFMSPFRCDLIDISAAITLRISLSALLTFASFSGRVCAGKFRGMTLCK